MAEEGRQPQISDWESKLKSHKLLESNTIMDNSFIPLGSKYQNSSLITPMLSIDNNPASSNSDTLLKLRITDESLQNEKMARKWIGDHDLIAENEVQNAKILMASLNAKIDKLQEKSLSDDLVIQELTKKLSEADQNFRDFTQQMSVKTDKDTLKLQQMLQEIISKQRNAESVRQEQEGQNRVVLEQLNHMRYKMESYIIKTDQVGSDLHVKSRDWVAESQKGSEAIKAIKNHDQALNVLHSVLDSTNDSLMRRIEGSHTEIKQRLESEQRARQQFETNMRDLCSEWRKVVQNQERELIDRIEGLRQNFQRGLESECSIRESSILIISNSIRDFEKQVKDTESGAVDQFNQRIRALENLIAEERQSLNEQENRLQNSLEEGLAFMQSNINKRMTESYEHNMETKHSMSQIAKTLQESISIADKSSASKIKGLEDVIRAEIKSRIDTDATISGLAVEIKKNIEIIEEKTLNHLKDSQDQIRADIIQISDELKATSEMTTETINKTITILEVDVEKLSKALKGNEINTLHALEEIRDKLSQGVSNVEEKAEQNKLELQSEIEKSNEIKNGHLNAMAQIENNLNELESRVNDKLNFKAIQIDSTMDAFKAELEGRATKDDLLKASEQVKTEIKSFNAAIEQKLDLISDKLIKQDEMTSDKDLIKDVVKSVEVIKSAIDERIDATNIRMDELCEKAEKNILICDDLKKSEFHLTNNFEKIRSEVKKCTSDFDVKIEETKNQFQESISETQKELDEKISTAKNSIDDKVDNATLKEIDQKYNLIVTTIHDTLNAMQTALMDRKEEIADLEDEFEKRAEETSEKNERHIQATQVTIEKLKKDIDQLILNQQDKIMKKINENLSSLNINANKQKNAIEKVETELIDRSKLFNSKVKDIFKAIKEINDSKESYQDEILNQLEKMEMKIEQAEESLKAKLNMHHLEKQSNEIEELIEKIDARIDVNHHLVEQLQKRMTEQEQVFKERQKGIDLATERYSKDQAHSLRSLKDSFLRKIDYLENKLKGLPQSTDIVTADIKELRQDLKNHIQRAINKIEGDIIGLKADMKFTVTERNLDVSITNAITPLQKKIYDLEELIDSLNKSEEHPYRSPLVSQATDLQNNVYKPADMTFGSRTKSYQRIDNEIEQAEQNEATSKLEFI